MPLPQQVIEQLGRESDTSHTGASGALLFCGALFVLVLALYAGIKFAYEPYLNSQISGLQSQVAKANASVSTDKQNQLINFYSQITNLKTVLAGHVYASHFLSWLGANTEANVYYQSLDLVGGNKVTLKGIAKTEADVNQQVAIFESSSGVANAVVSTVGAPQGGATSVSGLGFTVTLTMDPSVFSSTTP